MGHLYYVGLVEDSTSLFLISRRFTMAYRFRRRRRFGRRRRSRRVYARRGGIRM